MLTCLESAGERISLMFNLKIRLIVTDLYVCVTLSKNSIDRKYVCLIYLFPFHHMHYAKTVIYFCLCLRLRHSDNLARERQSEIERETVAS